MLDENRFAKYALYALGEIILVVIGILIALQINNNNEAKKSRVFELKMLNEIRNELIQDTIYFKMIKGRVEKAMEAANAFMLLASETEPNVDSIKKYGPIVSLSFQYIYHKGAYEALKSTGIDRISNDSIRLMLTDMYDFKLPRAQNFIETNQSSKIGKMEEFALLADLNIKIMPNGQARPDVKPKKSYKGNKDVVKLLFNKMGSNFDSKNRLEALIIASENLLQLLDRELEIKDPLQNIPENNW